MTSLADKLLDAQVAWVLDQVKGDSLADLVERDVDDLLDLAGEVTLNAAVDVAEVQRVARRLIATVPATTAAGEAVRGATEVVLEGPKEPFALSELVTREQVETLVDEALGATHLVKLVLDELAESPLVASVASKFMGRIVGEMLAANKAVADKIPGLGAMMSFGTSAASRMTGAADKQLGALIGDTAGKGATFAVRRLNNIVLETMKDPTTRAAVLQVWDTYADERVPAPTAYVDADHVRRLVAVVHEMVATAAATDPVGDLVEALIANFFELYGEHPISTLIEELALDRDDLVADAQAFAARAVAAATESGRLEALVRARLAPFFASPAVAEILGSV